MNVSLLLSETLSPATRKHCGRRLNGRNRHTENKHKKDPSGATNKESGCFSEEFKLDHTFDVRTHFARKPNTNQRQNRKHENHAGRGHTRRKGRNAHVHQGNHDRDTLPQEVFCNDVWIHAALK